jgi:hypothetical protein
MSDAELNKAALLIAKLLIRTREGKLQWESENSPLSSFPLSENFLTSSSLYKAKLDEGIEAHLSRNDKELGFKLCGPPAVDLPSYSGLAAMLGGRDSHEIISISLEHSYGRTGRESPETIVYRDLAELIFLAENPKSVSDDLRYQQALTYLDKLSA